MKRHAWKVLMAVGLLAALAAPSMAANLALKANIPFSFAAGSVNLPAGEYTVEQHVVPGVLALRGADLRIVTLFTVSPKVSAEVKDTASLVFNKYGDQYFLSQIWISGRNSGYQLPRTRRERELIAAAPAHPVVLAAVPTR